jgi:hypothetical protein
VIKKNPVEIQIASAGFSISKGEFQMCSTMNRKDYFAEVNDLMQTFLDTSIDDYDDLESKVFQWWRSGATPEQAFRNIKELILESATFPLEYEYC